MKACTSLVTMLATVALLQGQQTWTVDRWNRPGTDFTDLQPAVGAAASGDTLFVRVTSNTSFSDFYNAPIIDGKGITIIGESAAIPVYVGGGWTIRNVPAGETVLLSNLTLAYRFSPIAAMRIVASNNPGAIVLDAISTRLVVGVSTFTDCSLVVISHCTIDVENFWWDFLRSTLMMNDSVITHSSPSSGIGATGTVIVTDGTVHIAGSRIVGGDGVSITLPEAGAPLHLCRSTAHLSASTVIEGGVDYFGSRREPIYNSCINGNPPPPWPDAYYDASTVFIGALGPRTNYHPGPQSGVLYTMTPGTLQIAQHSTQQALTILLMAPLQTTPWTYVIGPVYLDPSNLWSDLAVAPISGPLVRTLPVPPTIPLGSMVGVQAFELTSQGQLLASNVTVVGIFE